MTVHLLAYAKLNLFLDVCGRRSDGFHDIQSLVQTIDLADRITIGSAPDVQVACSVELSGPNIVEQAVRELLQEKRTRQGVAVFIEKNIPIGAGLGGGSSDAAAVLAIVNRLIPPQISSRRLAEIAGGIGSDVPLFLTGGCISLVGLGRPEQQRPLRTETFVVLAPDAHCSTKDVYAAWRPTDSSTQVSKLGCNHLATAAARIHPELSDIGNIMGKLGGLYSGMTGSGSAFFAAFRDAKDATSALKTLTRQGLGHRVYYCQPTQSGFAELSDKAWKELPDMGQISSGISKLAEM